MSTATLLFLAASLRGQVPHGDSSGTFASRSAGPALPGHLSGQGRAAPGARQRQALRFVAALLLLVPGGEAALAQAKAPAQGPASPARIGSSAPGPCVEVEVAGHRAGHLDCATRKLEQAGRKAQEQARAGIDTPVPRAGSADTTVGVASLPGSRLRMGNALGNSVHPQRPARPLLPPRPGGGP